MNKGVIEQIAKPMEIYRNPKSLFVAKFVGNPPMNIIQVKNGEKLLNVYSKRLNSLKMKLKQLELDQNLYALLLTVKEK